MKFSLIATLATTVSVLAAPVTTQKQNKTILLTNDDGWAATNIRATYRDLTKAGYDVLMVAPVLQRSGFGGQFGLPTSKTLQTGGEFNYPPAGSPSWGYEESDMNVWYFNGTPASCVAFGLNYVLPNYFNNKTVDLVVSGPNEGTNLSPGLYTLSGTIGATYSAVNRGLPAIGFSGSNSNNSFYKDDVAHAEDPNFAPNILSKKVVEMVDALFGSFVNREHLLPLTTGLNVNFPNVGAQCTDPKYVQTRLTGTSAMSPSLKMVNGLPAWNFEYPTALTECVFGDCELPSESWILKNDNCLASVSSFSVDYDASYQQEESVKGYLSKIFA